MEEMKNLKDEEVKQASGGDQGDKDNSSWVDIAPIGTNRPQFPEPDPKPIVIPNPKPNPNSGLVCPKCGNDMMFKIVEVTPQGKRLRCTVCKTEFIK